MISEYLGFDSDYIILGLAGVVIILLILIITNMVQTGKLKKRYKVFMSGKLQSHWRTQLSRDLTR